MDFGVLAAGWHLVVGSSLLTTLGVYVLARFTNTFDAYSGERAKLLARFNSLDELVKETRDLTQIAEVIKAKVGDQVWDRQIRWSFKRDIYVNALQAVGRIRNELARLLNAFQAEQRGQEWALEEARTANERAQAAHIDLLSQFDISPIVLSPKAYEALRSVLRVFVGGWAATAEETQAKIAEVNRALTELTEEAKTDLGYVSAAT
ncbi:MAG: hypothetical protein KIT09_03515 [Bryobacteraceae bacterium]|nr:hypothetical protein [Bryobacteraceae bacterium]